MGALDQIRKIFCFAASKHSLKRKLGGGENNYYITVELAQEDLEIAAERQEYYLKLLEMDLKFKYTINQKHSFEPFRTKDMN